MTTPPFVGWPVNVTGSGTNPPYPSAVPVSTSGSAYPGPLGINMTNAASSDLVTFWNGRAGPNDIFGQFLANVNTFHSPVDVTVGKRFVVVKNTQVPTPGPLSPDPTAVPAPGGPVTFAGYNNESTSNITTLLTDLTTTHNNPSDGGAYGLLQSYGMTTVYFVPLGQALQNGTGDGNFNALCNAADGIIFQTQRLGQFGGTTASYISGISATMAAIHAATSKPFLVQIQTKDPNLGTVMGAPDLVDRINALWTNFPYIAGVEIFMDASTTTVAEHVMGNYR